MILVAVNFSVIILLTEIGRLLPIDFLLDGLRIIFITALGLVGLWYAFALPLRLTRYLSRPTRPAEPMPHPLDGAWAPSSSWLDTIKTRRDQQPSVPPKPPMSAADRSKL